MVWRSQEPASKMFSLNHFAVVRTVQRVEVSQFRFVNQAHLLHLFFISPSHLRCKSLFIKSNLILKLLKAYKE